MHSKAAETPPPTFLFLQRNHIVKEREHNRMYSAKGAPLRNIQQMRAVDLLDQATPLLFGFENRSAPDLLNPHRRRPPYLGDPSTPVNYPNHLFSVGAANPASSAYSVPVGEHRVRRRYISPLPVKARLKKRRNFKLGESLGKPKRPARCKNGWPSRLISKWGRSPPNSRLPGASFTLARAVRVSGRIWLRGNQSSSFLNRSGREMTNGEPARDHR